MDEELSDLDWLEDATPLDSVLCSETHVSSDDEASPSTSEDLSLLAMAKVRLGAAQLAPEEGSIQKSSNPTKTRKRDIAKREKTQKNRKMSVEEEELLDVTSLRDEDLVTPHAAGVSGPLNEMTTTSSGSEMARKTARTLPNVTLSRIPDRTFPPNTPDSGIDKENSPSYLTCVRSILQEHKEQRRSARTDWMKRTLSHVCESEAVALEGSKKAVVWANETVPDENTFSLEDAISENPVVEDVEGEDDENETRPPAWMFSITTKSRPEPWTLDEKRRYIDCIQQFGMDFSIINYMFPGRSRKEMRRMYRAMQRANPQLLTRLLSTRKASITPEEFEEWKAKSNATRNFSGNRAQF